MPLPLIPLIAAGASIIGQGMSSAATAANNRKSRQWSEHMYDRQRADSLADWNMTNEYNSPSGQMARLKAAGLNPNLVYGHGADAQGGQVRPSSVESWKPNAPTYDGSGVANSLLSIYDTRVKEAQTNNLEAQHTNIIQDTLLKAAQTASTTASTDKTAADTAQTQFNLNQAKSLQQVTLEKAKAELDQTRANTRYTLNNDERQAALTATTLSKAVEEILLMRSTRDTNIVQRKQMQQQTANLVQDSRIKELDINLKKAGIQPSDPIWARIIAQIAGGTDLEKIKAEYKDIFSGKGKPYKFHVPGVF